ncbi:MAG: dihydrodipicolinate synthase family protein [Rhizobiales bacterium]|nr:dihydrodipicolinate synthase family protein [Hyphomicrobiales bacterium]
MPRSGVLPRGIVASSVTPFHSDGSVHHRQIKPHIDWLIDEGVAGLSPLGSAGEFFAMETDDRKRVLESVVEANAGRVPIMAGTHHYSTRIAIDLSKHAEQTGADSLLIVPPYYALPTPREVMDHYRRIAETVTIPIVLYHNSGGTNVDLGTDELLTLFQEEVIAGIKLSHLLPDRIVELLQQDGPRLTVYAGIDYVAFEALCHGADGWISAIPSITPAAAAKLFKTISDDQDLASARQQWQKLAPLMRYVFRASHIARGNGPHWAAIMKAALNMIGPPVGIPQPPIASLSTEDSSQLAGLLRDLGYSVRAP